MWLVFGFIFTFLAEGLVFLLWEAVENRKGAVKPRPLCTPLGLFFRSSWVVVCDTVLTFVCMLRYWMWNVVPIWFLDSSIFMVVRWADLRSGSGILRYLWWYAVPIPFLYSSILIGIFCTSLTFQDRTPSPLPSPACFFLSVGSVSQRKVASGRAAAEEG